jgi:hypothetical protein
LIRVPRVDQFFALLLGSDVGTDDPGSVGGHLGQFRTEGGYAEDQVRTIEEERIQTSFITLVDWVVSLYQSWRAARPHIDPFAQPGSEREPFFGPGRGGGGHGRGPHVRRRRRSADLRRRPEHYTSVSRSAVDRHRGRHAESSIQSWMSFSRAVLSQDELVG